MTKCRAGMEICSVLVIDGSDAPRVSIYLSIYLSIPPERCRQRARAKELRPRRVVAAGVPGRWGGAHRAPRMVRILEDLSNFTWRDSPGAWHQQMARIVDHRFSSFDELYTFALNAKKAGVSAIMLVEIQKTSACPGPWYNGLQLCDHINGTNPAADGSLDQWRRLLQAHPGC